MNKKIIYYDGKIVVLDENGKERQIVYTDNYYKILVQENIIEACENIIRSLESESDKYKRIKLMERLSVLYPFLAFTFIPPIFLTLMNNGAGISNNEVVDTMLGSMTTNELIMSLAKYFVPVGSLTSLTFYNRCVKDDKCEDGVQTSLEFLRKYLENQKEILESLKKDNSDSNKEDRFKVCNVDDSKDLKALYRYRDLFFDLGYGLKKNYRYYEKTGELPKKLSITYSKEENKVVKEYLEEKGKTLRKGSK